MSMSTLMKNVYTFADILRQTGGDSITHWNAKSLHNAFNWANYCQRVYEETLGRPYRSELDRHIKAVSLYLPQPCCLDLSLDSLQHAETLLVQALVNNPHTSPRLLEHIVDRCMAGDGRLESFINVCSVRSESSSILHTFEEVLGCLGVPCEEYKLESQAETLLTILISQYKYSTSEERYKVFVCGVLNQLTKQSDGWNILAHLMCTKKNDEKTTGQPSLEAVHDTVLWWVTENHHQNNQD